jgi:hypothetical protein
MRWILRNEKDIIGWGERKKMRGFFLQKRINFNKLRYTIYSLISGIESEIFVFLLISEYLFLRRCGRSQI